MYTINNTKNCTIYSSSLYEDLSSYNLIEENNNLFIQYTGDNTKYPVSIKLDPIKSFITDDIDNTSTDIWLPAIIKDDDNINSQLLFNKMNIRNKILGIESVLSFKAKFDNWIPNDNNTIMNMHSNWYITSILPPVNPEYGLLYWYKIDGQTENNRKYLLKDIPNGTIIRSDNNIDAGSDPQKQPAIPNTINLVKLKDTIIKRLDKQSVKFDDSGVNFGAEKQIYNLKEYQSFDSATNKFTIASDNNRFNKNNYYYTIYINDGEVFSYYDSKILKQRNLDNELVSKTYLSPILFPIYREIYNILTLNRNRGVSCKFSDKQARLLQKLCYYLSTHPQIDRTTVKILNNQNINNFVTNYINSFSEQKTIDDEISKLKLVLKNINTEFKKYNLTTGLETKNSNNFNFINNKTALTKKILAKYKSQLLIDNELSLKYKSTLKNGPHAVIGLSSFTLADKNADLNKLLFNNFSMSVGNIDYTSKVSAAPSGSIISISGSGINPIEIPLADIAMSFGSVSEMNLGSGMYVSWDPPKTKCRVDAGPYDSKTSIFWELLSGPSTLRFTDTNKDQFKVQVFTTSADRSPDVWLAESGNYTLKCTATTNGIVKSDHFIITTDANKKLKDITIDIANSGNNNIIDTIPKKIGVHKHGMVWLLDTNHYIQDNGTLKMNKGKNIGGIDFAQKLQDIKIDLPKNNQFNIIQKSGDLKFNFKPDNPNTKILLDSISIENVRYTGVDTSQCISFYNENIYREVTTNANGPIFGASSFFRNISRDYRLQYFSGSGLVFGSYVELSAPKEVSTTLAPDLLNYGGYPTGMRNKIGIKIPNHENVVANNSVLPKLTTRNDIVNPENIYCFLKEVKQTDAGTIFTKGFFDPTIGFTVSRPEISGSSVVIDNELNKQSSFVFKGAGFLDMKLNSEDPLSAPYKSTIDISNIAYKSMNQYANHYGYRNYNYNLKSDPNFLVDDPVSDLKFFNSYNGSGYITSTYTIPPKNSDFFNSLKIQDLEVKLNFLNYINPKNLIIWLDIKPYLPAEISDSMVTNSGTGLLTNYREINTISSLTSYNNNLQSQNSGLRLYLLNQEHINEYTNNFSITFSDNTNKFISTNSLTTDILYKNYNNITLSNNNSISPSIYATGFNDIDSALFIGTIKTNNINNINNMLLKYKNLPLANTKFTLNILPVNNLELDNRILDNLQYSNNVDGVNSRELSSDNINNSLCSWEIIVHTTGIKQNINSDSLGKINYAGFIKDSGSAMVTGYNYIGNFSNYPHMIPSINLNAPYDYLANICDCSYDDPMMGKSISYTRPSYTDNLLTISKAANMYQFQPGSTAGTLIGSMVAMKNLQDVYAQGGRNDPIVNMLIEMRLMGQQELQDSQFYKPVYDRQTFGKPDRAVVCLSKDGVYWYDVDVSIFRYINTPPIQQNTYEYIKLISTGVFPQVSNFAFKTIKDYKDLNLFPLTYTFTKHTTTNDLPITDASGVIPEGSMVLLTAQSGDSSKNGYYIVQKQSDWLRVPSLDSKHYALYNNVGSKFKYDILNTKQNLLIDGIRAYNFFDINDKISISGINNTLTVIDKSLVQQSDGSKTVLTISSGLSISNGYIGKNASDADTLLLFKKDYTSIGDYNLWGSEKTQSQKLNNNKLPSQIQSSYGQGSIGYGTDQLSPEILYRLSFKNSRLFNTNEILNNDINNKYKYNQINISGYSNTDPQKTIVFNNTDSSGNLLKGYSYSPKQFGYKASYDQTQSFINAADNYLIMPFITEKDLDNHRFIEVKSSKFKGSSIPNSGYLNIENDFISNIKVCIDSSGVKKIQNRLNYLYVSGIPNAYSSYKNLPADPTGCLISYDINTCPKTTAYQKIKILEEEKRNLSYALNIADTGNNIIPYISGSVIENTGTLYSGTLSVDYYTNNYLYWINIDPWSTGRLNSELSVKVVTDIDLSITPLSENINEGVVPGTESHIAPLNMFRGIPSGVQQGGSGVYMKKIGRSLTYKMCDETIKNDKNLWGTDINWDNPEIFTYGSTDGNGDSKKIFISRLNSPKDMLVQLKETYIRPSGTNAKKIGIIKNLLPLDTQNTLLVKFKNIPRKLKGIDTDYGDKYIYTQGGDIVKSSKPFSSVGYIANNFTCWHCIDASGNFIPVPDYYRVANEMRYRAFYGSLDGIENKNSPYIDSKEDWEWIPYEYYTSGNMTNTSINQNNINLNNSIVSTGNYFNVLGVSSTATTESKLINDPLSGGLTDHYRSIKCNIGSGLGGTEISTYIIAAKILLTYPLDINSSSMNFTDSFIIKATQDLSKPENNNILQSKLIQEVSTKYINGVESITKKPTVSIAAIYSITKDQTELHTHLFDGYTENKSIEIKPGEGRLTFEHNKPSGTIVSGVYYPPIISGSKNPVVCDYISSITINNRLTQLCYSDGPYSNAYTLFKEEPPNPKSQYYFEEQLYKAIGGDIKFLNNDTIQFNKLSDIEIKYKDTTDLIYPPTLPAILKHTTQGWNWFNMDGITPFESGLSLYGFRLDYQVEELIDYTNLFTEEQKTTNLITGEEKIEYTPPFYDTNMAPQDSGNIKWYWSDKIADSDRPLFSRLINNKCLCVQKLVVGNYQRSGDQI